LDADILGPTNETTEVTALGADRSSNSGGTSAGGVKRIGGLGDLRLLVLLRFLSFWCLIKKKYSSEYYVSSPYHIKGNLIASHGLTILKYFVLDQQISKMS
jgi:hypothetical protein